MSGGMIALQDTAFQRGTKDPGQVALKQEPIAFLRRFQCLLRPPALRDVFLDREVMGNGSLAVHDRANGCGLPEELPILFFVTKFAAPFAPLADGGPQIPVKIG